MRSTQSNPQLSASELFSPFYERAFFIRDVMTLRGNLAAQEAFNRSTRHWCLACSTNRLFHSRRDDAARGPDGTSGLQSRGAARRPAPSSLKPAALVRATLADLLRQPRTLDNSSFKPRFHSSSATKYPTLQRIENNNSRSRVEQISLDTERARRGGLFGF